MNAHRKKSESEPTSFLPRAPWWAASLIACLALPCAACQQQTQPVTPEATHDQPVVYGNDDRSDWYEHPDDALRDLTQDSIVALMRYWTLDTSDPDDIRVIARTLGSAYGLCEDQRFRDQPNAASCSGTLIDDDLVLTAGHCVETESECRTLRFVFDYYMEDERELARISEEDVYSCRQIVVQELSDTAQGILDYAIIQLDRPATPARQPAPVRQTTAPMIGGEELTVIGFGSGLPAKIDDGGQVISGRERILDYFVGSLDTFGGNSGSGVFDADGEVAGILVRGEEDYDIRGSCAVVNKLPEPPIGDTTTGEAITYAARAIEELCESGWPSVRLCDIEAECGDGVCSIGESFADCPDDCDEAACGDGICAPGESGVCAEDCESDDEPTGPPEEWSCPVGFYDALDGCDCQCGAWDPDCNFPWQDVQNCGAGEICSEDGTCIEDEQDAGRPADIPDAWICPFDYFEAEDGCDCACGAWDPDCADRDQALFNCGPEQVCDSRGVCVDADAMPTPDAGMDDAGFADASGGFGGIVPNDDTIAGCAVAVAPTAVPSRCPPLGLVAAAVVALVVRRRRAR